MAAHGKKWRGPRILGPLFNGGAKGANRTRDTALFRRVLYQLSYLGQRL